MSDLMKRLDNEAITRARKQINNQFITNNDLNNINNYKLIVNKQIKQSESQLTIAVSSKLDALKRAYDIIDESSIRLKQLLTNLNKIDEKINNNNTMINKFNYIKYINNCNNNINKVIQLVDIFIKIPDRINYLNDLLSQDSLYLKDVYIESIQLVSLKDGLTNELNNKQYNNNNTLKSFINNYLSIIPKLFNDVKDHIYDNINHMLILGIESPSILVMTFEVIEMHIEYINRRYHKESNEYEDFYTIITNNINNILIQKIIDIYIKCKESIEYQTQPFISILNASTNLIHFLNDTLQDVIICIPNRFNIIDIYIGYLHEFIYNEISKLINEHTLNQINLSNILDIINWIEYYKAQIISYQPSLNLTISSTANETNFNKLLVLLDDLLHEYQYRIKIQIQEWFINITNQPLNLIKTTNGLIITTNPEDMFNIIYIQINIALEKLSSSYLYDVINTCLSILRNIQRQTYDNLSNHWRDYDIEVLCSIINDNQRMQEKTDELNDYINRLVNMNNDSNRLIINSMLDELSSEYIALAVNAVNFLARLTLTDVDEHVFSKLFTAEWESGEQLISILTATLDDYFKDIFIWLNEYFYSKYIKEIFYCVINSYVMSIRRLANGAFRFINEITIANRLIKDKDLLEEYFSKYIDILKRGGLKIDKQVDKSIDKQIDKSPISYELSIFKALAIIITTTNTGSINSIEKEIKLILSRYQSDGLKLLIAIYLSNPMYSQIDKKNYIDKVIKFYETNYISSTSVLDKYKIFDVVDTAVIKGYLSNNNVVTSSSSTANSTTNTATSNLTMKAKFWSKSKPVDKTY